MSTLIPRMTKLLKKKLRTQLPPTALWRRHSQIITVHFLGKLIQQFIILSTYNEQKHNLFMHIVPRQISMLLKMVGTEEQNLPCRIKLYKAILNVLGI